MHRRSLVECSAKLNDHISVVTGSLFVNCVIAISLSLSGTERRELKVTQDLEPDIIRFLKRTLSVTRKETINQSLLKRVVPELCHMKLGYSSNISCLNTLRTLTLTWCSTLSIYFLIVYPPDLENTTSDNYCDKFLYVNAGIIISGFVLFIFR